MQSAFGGAQVLDNGGEGSAATAATTPTAPRRVTLRAVRQVVTVLDGRKKEQRKLDEDRQRMTDIRWFLVFPTLCRGTRWSRERRA